MIIILVLIVIACPVFFYNKRFKKKNKRSLFRRSKKPKNNFGFAFYNSTAVEDDTIHVADGSNDNLILSNMLKSIEFSEDQLELGRVIGKGKELKFQRMITN